LRNESNKFFYTWRYLFVIGLLLVGMAGLVWRMVDLTIIDRAFLKHQGDARSVRSIEIPAYRGMITDRNGEPLAISTPVQSVWANPKDFTVEHEALPALAQLLKTSVSAIKKRIQRSKHREFVYLKRRLSPAVALRIKALSIPGVNLQREFKRFYPEGEITAHLLGLTNVDDRGQEGLELAYDGWLHGTPGKKRVLKDRLGHIVADLTPDFKEPDFKKPDFKKQFKEPQPGHNLVLSIDRRIQYLAFRELKNAVEAAQAKSGSIVVLDVSTGEVLAMVNQPSYNSNLRPSGHDGRYRNRAVTDVFEPGSVMKAFSVASALDSGEYTPDTLIDTRPGWSMVTGHTINDEHNNGVITLTQVLQRSSNVGVSRTTLSLPNDRLWGLLRRFGFAERSNIGFPGESPGSLVKYYKNTPFVTATLAFGYGISVTPLQLARAYSVFATQGKLLPVSLLRVDKTPVGKQILNKVVAEQMLNMLHSVVSSGGTGVHAQIESYTVAGKTGTARIAGGEQGYYKNRHVASFVGIAPVGQPRLVVAVVIYDPSGEKYYGGQIAAPVFAKVTAGALRILNVPPDLA